MALHAYRLVSSAVSVPPSRIYAAPKSGACSSSSNSSPLPVISSGSCNGGAKLEVTSLRCSSRDLSNLARFGPRLSTSGKQCFRFVQYWEKRRRVQWSVVQAVLSPEAEAEASEESTSQLVDKLLDLVKDTDRGALLGPEAQGNVADVVCQLEKMGMPEPLKSPFIFGDWNVAYSSNPTSPGGGYRTWLGRLIFRTRDMIQSIIEPDGVVNVVRFALFGFIGGEVTLRGKLTPLDSKMIQVDFQPPDLQIGPFKFSYGGMSMVKISVIYLEKDIRLGRGSRGTIFVFTRRQDES